MIDTSKKEYWLKVEELIRVLLNKFIGRLDSESVEAIHHYLEHSEYEMAFEGLFIELMKLKADINKNEKETYFKLARELGLEQDSFFDGDFWNKFKLFVSPLPSKRPLNNG